MKEIISKQMELLDNIIKSFEMAEKSLIEKDIENLTKNIAKVEEYSFEFEKYESKFVDILNEMGYKSVKDYLDKANNEEMAVLIAGLVEKLNNLSIIMNNFREMIEFENRYFEFVKSLFSKSTTTSTYTKSGYNKSQSNIFNKSF